MPCEKNYWQLNRSEFNALLKAWKNKQRRHGFTFKDEAEDRAKGQRALAGALGLAVPKSPEDAARG